jgi:hypothetical protein
VLCVWRDCAPVSEPAQTLSDGEDMNDSFM